MAMFGIHIGLLGSKARHSVKHPHRGLRRSQRYRFSAVCGGARGRGGSRCGGEGRRRALSWAPHPPVNINTGSGRPRLRIDIRRGEITTLNIYEALVSRIKIRLFQVINPIGICQWLSRQLAEYRQNDEGASQLMKNFLICVYTIELLRGNRSLCLNERMCRVNIAWNISQQLLNIHLYWALLCK